MNTNLREFLTCAIACVAVVVCGAIVTAGLRAWGAGRTMSRAANPATQGFTPLAGDTLVVAPGVQITASVDATQMLAFPNCTNSSGQTLAGCVAGWRICGNSGSVAGQTGGAPSPPYCIDLYPGANSLELKLIENTAGQTTEFPVGNLGLNVGSVGN